MKFTIRLREKGTSRTWTETYTMKELNTPEKVNAWVQDTLVEVNNNLLETQNKREVIDITLVVQKMEHDWEKSNLVTIIEDGMPPYDTYVCRKCGGTGKRLGLAPMVAPDLGVSQYCEVG